MLKSKAGLLISVTLPKNKSASIYYYSPESLGFLWYMWLGDNTLQGDITGAEA
jgi:hypothetical protein